jgi:hypothetical protein
VQAFAHRRRHLIVVRVQIDGEMGYRSWAADREREVLISPIWPDRTPPSLHVGFVHNALTILAIAA